VLCDPFSHGLREFTRVFVEFVVEKSAPSKSLVRVRALDSLQLLNTITGRKPDGNRTDGDTENFCTEPERATDLALGTFKRAKRFRID
jgi:hypothetical protein